MSLVSKFARKEVTDMQNIETTLDTRSNIICTCCSNGC
jgi:hypothetical protein